ncbi:GtrA family protein [Nocardioides sp.]|uniref:GtrA family protein n=1 Tax=Nocardioides sp. TaxID=35761 RepID=UPI003566F526
MGVRWQRLLTEASRFAAVGGLATVVAFVLFNTLVHGFSMGQMALLHDHVIVAYVVANTVGMAISYRGTRSWAFRDRPPRQADGGRLAFVAINLVTMLLPIGCLWFSRNVLGLDDPLSDNIAANVIGLLMGLVSRFYLYRTFVFRRPLHVPHRSLSHPSAQADGPLSDATGRARPDRVPPSVL